MEPQQNPQLQQHQQSSEDSTSGKNSSFLCRQSSTRWTPTTDQIRILKDLYYNNGVRSPSGEQIQRISARLSQYGKIEGKNVFYWFQNHKARERQKKRFAVDVAMQKGIGVGGWKPEASIQHKYTISPGYSSPSSPSASGVLSVGQMGSIGYGSVFMERSFRDCSISGGGVDPYSSSYTLFDKRKSIEAFQEAAPEIETLPLFPMHEDEINGFCTGNQEFDGYYTGRCWSENENNGARTSLELSLNSYSLGSPSSP